MSATNYSLSWLLPFVRESLQGRSNLSYSEFTIGLWQTLERVGVEGVARLTHHDYTGQGFSSPPDLQLIVVEAFYYLFHNSFIAPGLPMNVGGNPDLSRFHLTQRGFAWVADNEPMPEDSGGYLEALRRLVPSIDPIVEQYIQEGLIAFERQTYFAAAVMIGAASEKTIYLLAAPMMVAISDPARKRSFKKNFEERRLAALLDSIKNTISGARSVLPHAVFDGSDFHLLSLFQAIRVQRNDAVHPLNAAVSSDSVRLSFRAFPYAAQKSEALREWFQQNPNSI